MRAFRRSIHTRPKKVSVQLLKDFAGIGVRGQVVEVREGMMRNLLHPHNGAYYLRPGEPLRIPLREPETPQTQRETNQPEDVSEEAAVAQKKPPKPSLLDMLQFPSASGSQPSTEQATTSTSPEREPPTASDEVPRFEWQNEFVAKATRTPKK